MDKQPLATDYELSYVTRESLEMRPRNLEGWIITEPGWYWNLEHTPDAAYMHGPYATAREAAREAERS